MPDNEIMTDEDYYKALSNYEKLNMILSTCLNKILSSISFNTYTRIILCVKYRNQLNFYIHQNGYEFGDFTKELDPTINYDEEDILFLIETVCAQLDDQDNEENRIIPMARARSLGELDGNPIYILPAAYNEGFPKGLLWHKLYEFYADSWREIILEIEERPLFEYASPEEALQKIDFEWSWTTVACCRALYEGGFNTGYGDPYESEFLFDLISEISALNYESRNSKGIIVAIPDAVSDKDKLLIQLVDHIPLNENLAKAFRKLIEMTTDKVALAFGDYYAVGLVDVSHYEWKIVISGQGKWKYYYKEQVIFTVDNGRITIGKEASSAAHYLRKEDEIIVPNFEIVEKIIQAAMKQDHGTCVLFSDNAEEEAKRLAKYRRCIQIESINLNDHSDMIYPLSAIDGALITDFSGNCFGIGAILDGEAHVCGDYGRGARFNSALNYIGWKKEIDCSNHYCAVVISEDGIFDIITTKNIERIIQELDNNYNIYSGNG